MKVSDIMSGRVVTIGQKEPVIEMCIRDRRHPPLGRTVAELLAALRARPQD